MRGKDTCPRPHVTHGFAFLLFPLSGAGQSGLGSLGCDLTSVLAGQAHLSVKTPCTSCLELCPLVLLATVTEDVRLVRRKVAGDSGCLLLSPPQGLGLSQEGSVV